MRLLWPALALLVLAGCNDNDRPTSIASLIDSAGIVIPDTATVDGVLLMQHGPDAFERAPQLTIDREPLVVYRDNGDPDFDLTWAFIPALLSDGRMIAIHRNGPPRMMLFDSRGRPSRILARDGEGPGELVAPGSPLHLGGDSLIVLDDGSRQALTILPNGTVESEPLSYASWLRCLSPLGITGDRRIIYHHTCIEYRDAGEPGTTWRQSSPVVLADMGRERIDTIALLDGLDMVSVETRYRSRVDRSGMELRFGRRMLVVPFGAGVAITTDDWVIELRDLVGIVTGRISLERSRRPVTEEMRAAQIAAELARMASYRQEAMVDPAESRRIAEEQPFADTLPAWGHLAAGEDGTLWAIDYIIPADTMVTVTAFRQDGAILGRLTIPRLSGPLWFGRDRVMLREEDQDGVVSYAVYRIVQRSEIR